MADLDKAEMLIQLNWRFWLCAAAIFVLIRLRLPRTTWFGILNLGALMLILGWQSAVFAAGFSASVWVALSVARRSSRTYQTEAIFLAIALGVGALLICQKLSINPFAGPSILPLSSGAARPMRLLEVVAFSYIALRTWDAIASVRQGSRLLNPLAISGYLAPFFMLPAGPINVYDEHLEFDDVPVSAPTWLEFLAGIETIVQGLFIKLVLAEGLRLFVVGLNGHWPAGGFANTLVIYVFIYLDFWGYSLVALGVGRLLGIPTPRNFNSPFKSRSLTEYWTRWHMSLASFVRRQIYFPLQMFFLRRTAGRHAHLANAVSLAVAFVFVGFWHRITLAFLAWGLLFAAMLSVEKIVRDKFLVRFLARHPKLGSLTAILGPIYVTLAVVLALHLTVVNQLLGD